MKNSDKFLLAIVIAALLLVAVAFFTALNRPEASYLPDDTPEGVVHNYLLALQKGDYDRAYGYLSPSLPSYPTSVAEFERDLEIYYGRFPLDRSVSFSLGETAATLGARAKVEVRETTYYRGDLFDSGQYTNTFFVSLVKESGQWKITDGGPYFAWCWTSDSGCIKD